MKPAPFRWHGPESVAEAVSVLSEVADHGKVLAGGQSLVPVLAMRLAEPADLVDINRIRALSYVRTDATGVTVVDARVVDDGDLVSSGGVTSGLDLALYLLERSYGPRIAHAVEQLFEYERRGTVWRALGADPLPF